jgi:glycosyltransferase involved in cell wall biosynthesis
MKFSVVIISRNVENFIRDCLDSLVHQSRTPDEVIVVDSDSTDATHEIVEEYAAKWPFVKLYVYSSQKGEGRNYGAAKSTGDIIAFIDSDAIAHALWVEEMIKAMENADVVAGREVRLGYHGFTSLKRVGMLHKGMDVTYPSVNLAYRRTAFEAINGFDTLFKEAEDVDINYRAVDAGFKLIYWPTAIVYHNARSTFTAFFKQAFWYGFGRKELSLRHGNLWRKYNPMEMVKVSKEENIWKLVRLAVSFLGYTFCKVVGKKHADKERFRASKVSER